MIVTSLGKKPLLYARVENICCTKKFVVRTYTTDSRVSMVTLQWQTQFRSLVYRYFFFVVLLYTQFLCKLIVFKMLIIHVQNIIFLFKKVEKTSDCNNSVIQIAKVQQWSMG